MHPSPRRTASVLLATTLALYPVPAAAAAPQWTVVPAPSPGNPSVLHGVTAMSRTNAWAVGSTGDWWNVRPQAIQWDGTTWRPTVVPLGGAATGELKAVDTTYSAAYAVGSADAQRRTLITRYRAGAWSVLPSPSPGVGAHELNAVTMLSDWDGWAVGAYDATAGGANRDNLILRWNGASWTQVPVPNAGTGINVLTGVTATGPNSAWAVGYVTRAGEGIPRATVTLRWDGVSWRRVPSPNLSDPATGTNVLHAVAAVSATDAWAVGFTSGQGWALRRPVALRWNGGAWISVPTPAIPEALEYTGVAAVSPSRVYFAGYRGRFVDQNMLVRWDGARLVAESVVEQAPSGRAMDPIGSALNDVAALPSGEAWAVGHLGNVQNRVLFRTAG